jgi:cell division cycle 20-like protein 1 (cofactor of APC complex)
MIESSHFYFQEKSQTVKRTGREGTEGSKDFSLSVYSCLLRNEILGAEIEDCKEAAASSSADERRAFAPLSGGEDNKNLFSFRPKRPSVVNEPGSPYSLTPVSAKSQKLLRSPRKASRKISKIPFKVLDAPELQDDFYLNLVDWSSQNVLSVGLGACVYLWSACTSQVR